MDIFSVITLCGGLAFFLFGMSTMSSSLEKLAGGRLEQLLKRMTDNRFKSLLLGAGITIAIQSSSAMTVMLVGLVNSGIMELGQTVGVIMGSNVGTTLTAWILSLSGIDSSSFWLQLLKPEVFSPLVALAGMILRTRNKSGRRRSAGSIMVGFAILMTGMEMMKNAVSPLADMPEFNAILTAFTNPFLGVLVGAVAGLATITPCAGYVEPWAAIVIGGLGSLVCYFAKGVQERFAFDDALEVWRAHGMGGVTGALLLGILASPNIDRVSASLEQFLMQLLGVIIVAVYSFFVTLIIFKVIDMWGKPIRVTPEEEVAGLDNSILGEDAYKM